MKYDLYVDLDGVLADFEQGIFNLTGLWPEKYDKHPFAYVKQMKAEVGFFENLPKMTDADYLWNHVKRYKPKILSAHGGQLDTAEEEKRAWVKRNFGDVEVILVEKGHDKPFAVPDIQRSLLIDDRSKTINPWIKEGGIGILHTSAENSIWQHKRLLNK